MNEDGDFFCEEHKPEKNEGQWWLELAFDEPCKCDLCEKQATVYVLEKQ